MAYGRKFAKKSYVRRVARKRPTRYNNKKSIIGLAKRVSTLQKNQRKSRVWSQYQIGFADQTVQNDYFAFNLMTPAAWTNIFQQPTAMENAQKAYTRSLYLDMMFRCGNEQSASTFKVFLVSIKPGAGRRYLETTSEGTSLSNEVHYKKVGIASNLNAQVMLNPAIYNIHRQKTFTISPTELTNNASGGSNQLATFKRVVWKMKWCKLLSSYGASDWRSHNTGFYVPPEKRLYVLVFNDNSAIDEEYPMFSVNCVWNVST